jgi:LPXTG-motif cell wall-anchored protein
MKKTYFKLMCTFLVLLTTITTIAQDSLQPIEPDMETSFENTELLIVALIGLALLLALYFFFRRRRGRN